MRRWNFWLPVVLLALLLGVILLGGEGHARVVPDFVDDCWGLRDSAPSGPSEDGMLLPERAVTAGGERANRKENGGDVSQRGGTGTVVQGIATWYGVGDGYHGRTMANGEVFDAYDPTIAAANQWPLGTILRVSHSGRTIVVVVSDKGAFRHELDLSWAAFESLAPLSEGVIEVSIEEVR